MMNLTSLVGLCATLLVTACGGTVASDETSGSSCTYDGQTYANGDSFESTDGCNTCGCTDGQVACTEMACGGGGSGSTDTSCTYNGQTYASGESFASTDGCNTCGCADGQVACSLMACAAAAACGGALGDTCTEAEYCNYQGNGDACGLADATAFCVTRPDVCTKDYSPVCGCDGITYSNQCQAAAAGTGILSTGECTTADGSCTLNGIEIPNGATMDSGDNCNLATCNDGVLEATDIFCDALTSCGGEGDAACSASQFCAYTAGVGLCGQADAPSVCLMRPSACTTTEAKVCGCDGTTYLNACQAALAGVGVLSDGAC